MGLYQIKKLLHSKRNNFQNQKKPFRMGEKSLPVIHPTKDYYLEYIELKKLNTRK
jgi:hypothetical protein